MVKKAPDEPISHRYKRARKFQRLQKDLGERVRELRNERKLTLEQLDELSGIDWRHIHKIEAGTLNVTLVTLYRLAEGLDVSVKDLLEAYVSAGKK